MRPARGLARRLTSLLLCRIGTSVALALLGVLAHIFPAEVRLEAVHLGAIVANQEDEILGRQGARGSPLRKLARLDDLRR